MIRSSGVGGSRIIIAGGCRRRRHRIRADLFGVGRGGLRC